MTDGCTENSNYQKNISANFNLRNTGMLYLSNSSDENAKKLFEDAKAARNCPWTGFDTPASKLSEQILECFDEQGKPIKPDIFRKMGSMIEYHIEIV